MRSVAERVMMTEISARAVFTGPVGGKAAKTFGRRCGRLWVKGSIYAPAELSKP